MASLLILDDQPVVVLGLRQVLKQIPGLVVEGDMADGRQLLEAVSKKTIHLVILDIWLRGHSTLEVLKELKARSPATGALVFMSRPEKEFGMHALHAGADGVIPKTASKEDLVRAVQKTAVGGKYFTPEMEASLLNHLHPHPNATDPLHKQLSGREYEVMVLLAQGNSNKEIIGLLSLSKQTISTYRMRVMEKMSMHSNADLARYVERQNGES